MVVGIVTLIKDEHFFLEEWIEHNLKLGFDKIIIFEDIDSTSHKEITDKYNKVELHSILEIDTYENLKNQFRQIPLYEHITYDYHYGLDWCAFWDIDEFITGNFYNIHELTNLCDKNNIYQIWMYWTFMTCNGIIECPKLPYKVTEMYTVPNYSIINDDFKKHLHHHKVILNLNKPHIWKNVPHVPITARESYICIDDLPWEIEFKHYLSKSYEEYVYKRLNKDLCHNNFTEMHARKKEWFWFFNSIYNTPEFKKKCEELDKKYLQ